MYTKDAIYYDLLNQSLQSGDVEFIQEQIPERCRNICELACGTGRIISQLRAPGRKLSGVDISEDMLRIAKNRYSDITWLKYDMRELPVIDTFDFVFCGYNAIQHLLNEEDIILFFQSAKRNMAPDGLLLIDLFNPDMKYLFPEGNRRALAAFEYEAGQTITVEESSIYDINTEINSIAYDYYCNGSFLFREDYQMKQYNPDVMRRLIRESGFMVSNCYGDYEGHEFTPESQKQIYILTID